MPRVPVFPTASLPSDVDFRVRIYDVTNPSREDWCSINIFKANATNWEEEVTYGADASPVAE